MGSFLETYNDVKLLLNYISVVLERIIAGR